MLRKFIHLGIDTVFDLSGKKALITGASGGIGEQLAKSFFESGAEIIITGTRENSLRQMKEKFGDRCGFFRCDLSEKSSITDLVSFLNENGGVDILVNNAGKTNDGLFLRMTDEQWDEVLALNLTSVMRLTRGVLRNMMKKRWGRIINVSSVVAVTGNSGQSNYVASKAGLIGMSKTLASEVATRGITVNCIAPGFVQTGMTGKLNETQVNSITARIPMGRIGLPEEICSSAVFLASQHSSYITGQTIHVNGGMAML